MTGTDSSELKLWISNIAMLIEKDSDIDPEQYISFLKDPSLCLKLIALIDSIPESPDDEEEGEEDPYFSACIFALDVCVAQLQGAFESGHKLAQKTIQQFMHLLAETINAQHHTLGFWLPILNAFYDVHLDLSPELQEAYFNLASLEAENETLVPTTDDHLQSIKEMIIELSDLSVFDIAENFFAQSHAMPVAFFSDLIVDLYSIEEGQDIALLALLHPNSEVRDMVIDTLEELMDTIVLTPTSLSRLQTIKNWYPAIYHEQFNHWIKKQRMKGVIFHKEETDMQISQISASEVDGSGAQGIFIHLKNRRKNRLCGMLFKQDLGIKDAWLTPDLTTSEIKKYFVDAFHDSVTLRKVDLGYLQLITDHFLAKTLANGNVPNLHFLEIQELLNLSFLPNAIDIDTTIQALSVQITPFTEKSIQMSFKRSHAWLRNKAFTESWYIENAHIDKLVNRCSNFVEGVKVCDIGQAIALVFEEEMETARDKWLFHFLWISLWLQAAAKKNENIWKDSLIIAYAIHTNVLLSSIPVLKEIVYQTVLNSIETMNERRTHLNTE